jgi:N-acetylmuramoyl-L-alanine amidase
MLEELRRVDRGVKKENFYVIKYTKMPAALVEVAFLSNPHEESLLASNLFKEKAARAIAQGIIDYIKKINNGR